MKFFQAPIFEDEDVTLKAQLLNALILSAFVAIPLLFIGNMLESSPNVYIYGISILGIALSFGLRQLMYQGQVYLASVLWVSLVSGIVTVGIIGLGTVRATNTSIFLINIAVAGFLLNRRAVIWVTVYSCTAVFLLGWAQNVGWLPTSPGVPGMSVSIGFNFLALFTGMAMLMSVSVRMMNRMIRQARREVIERRKTEWTLRQRDAIMEAATFAARKFLQSSNWRVEIDEVLAHLGEATSSSHVFIFENHTLADGTEVTSQRYEWTAPGMEPDINNLLYQNARLVTEETELWYSKMTSREAFYGTRDILSPKEKSKYEEQGLLSFINVPIFVGEKWWGVMGFDDYKTKREWTSVEVEAVKITASTLGAAIQRQINDEALRRGDAILQAVNYAAQQFFQSEDWRKNIDAVLEQLGRATQSSHAYIFERHFLANGNPVISQRYEWTLEGVKPDIDDPAFQEIEIFGRHSDPWYEKLSRGEVRHENLDTLPPEEVEFFKERGVKAIIDAPIMVANQWWGVIGFDDCFVMREWAVAEIDAIKIAASTLGAAIQRQASDEALRQSETRYRAELEERVQERTHQLAEALREIEGVSYTASHDLRAPVRAINGYANILLREFAEGLNDVERDYLQKIDRESHRMGNLLDDLIRLIQLNRQVLRITKINLSELAYKAVEECQRKYSDQQVEMDIAGELIVSGDQSMLQTVMDELLDNAWKFMKTQHNPCVEIGETTQEGQCVFFVRDNGIGVDMAYAHKLFRNFEQLHQPGTYEGTGMGLALVQRIVQRHGGKVWIEGAVGKGTTVFFTLGEEKENVASDV